MQNIDDLLCSYDYSLPDELIAQSPAFRRDSSRLLVVKKNNHEHSHFKNLADFLPEGALLVVNNTKVIPARVLGQRANGGSLEFLLLTPPPLFEISFSGDENTALVECLLKPSRSIQLGQSYIFGNSERSEHSFRIEILEKREFGLHLVKLFWRGDFLELLENIGNLPLPPYIHRDKNACDDNILLDKERYQTLHSKNSGSLAAPTAGLHFTAELRSDLLERGIEWTELCLHVGYGTFSPVRTENLQEHQMHSEYVELSVQCAEKIAKAKAEGRKVIAVGTTSLRTLEGLFAKHQQIKASKEFVNIFIRPGFQFQVIDGLITNFHLPKSSLIILISALIGRQRTLDLYSEAVQNRYRFFSYGDAMLISYR